MQALRLVDEKTTRFENYVRQFSRSVRSRLRARVTGYSETKLSRLETMKV